MNDIESLLTQFQPDNQQSAPPLCVAARKHKRSGLQTRKLLAHINCKQKKTSAHINCKQTHYYLQG
nr:hypothetical protein [Trichormus sp. ATA11-4-KO1]